MFFQGDNSALALVLPTGLHGIAWKLDEHASGRAAATSNVYGSS